MKKLLTKKFNKWAEKQEISKSDLAQALDEVAQGLYEADLGGNIIKKRIAFQGKGKRSSGRTIICYKKDDRAIFVYGFEKNKKDNLTTKDLKYLKALAKILLGYSEKEIKIAIKYGELMEA